MASNPPHDPPGPHPANRRRRQELRGPRRALIGLLAVAAVIAAVGGLALIIRPELRVLGRALEAIVESRLAPARATGVLLVVVIAASQAVAALLLVQYHVHARAIALGAALLVVAWSLLQMMLLNGVTWFQIVLFGVGALETFLVAGCTPRGRVTRTKPTRRR
jgi:hypothetical protein